MFVWFLVVEFGRKVVYCVWGWGLRVVFCDDGMKDCNVVVE